MFSANENITLRKHKRRIVDKIESTMPEDALDMGTSVMVMQVSCRAPGCVPLETAIIVVFPGGVGSGELLPGLPESKPGGSYKTKILKPMADVTDDDILDALPPAFEGGRRTMERLCINARDTMIAQITQLFGPAEADDPAAKVAKRKDEDEEAIRDRMAMAKYLQQCLQDYMDRNCQPPKWGDPFEAIESKEDKDAESTKEAESTRDEATTEKSTEDAKSTATESAKVSGKGNFIVKRPLQVSDAVSKPSSGEAIATRRSRQANRAAVSRALTGGSAAIDRLFNREHAPGIRQAGCPCCDPDDPSNVIDTMMNRI